MKVTFLGQGLTPEVDSPVGEYLMRFLNEEGFHSFTGFSAFASEAGVKGLSSHIEYARQNFTNLTLIVGVDQKGTSAEALRAILALEIPSFVFYQPSFPIFHPKIYLFEGDEKTELIIGSSNLTVQGLFINIESSLLVSIDNKNADDRKVIDDLKAYFKGIFDLTDPNLQPLSNELIEELVFHHIVPAEVERASRHDKVEQQEKEATLSLISKLFPKRDIAKVAKEFKRVRKAALKKPRPLKEDTSPPTVTTYGELVWAKQNLPKSDVQIPAREGTNPTGGLRLTQANFLVAGRAIDQTTYFRELFGAFKWETVSQTPYVEVAIVPFEITIEGKFIGRFNLEIRHKPSGEAGQRNFTTSISWGKAGEAIRNAGLVGAGLQLYKPLRKGEPFQIVFSR